MNFKNAVKAMYHNGRISYRDKRDIKKSIKKTQLLEGFDEIDYVEPTEQFDTTYDILNMSIEQAVPFYNGNDVAILNFADFIKPGGRYLTGGTGEEESLCHNSTLYPVLKIQRNYYRNNSSFANDGLYFDTALYSPCIKFGKMYCNVLSCSAPNYKQWSSSPKNAKVATYMVQYENNNFLKQRIDFILGCMRFFEQRTLLLGAFGCGSSGQSPTLVASYFHELLETKYKGAFERVIFVIPDEQNGNHQAFKYIFSKEVVFKRKDSKNFEFPFFHPEKDEIEIIRVKALDKFDAYKAIQKIVVAKGCYCDDTIFERISEVTDRSYVTVEEVIKQ